VIDGRVEVRLEGAHLLGIRSAAGQHEEVVGGVAQLRVGLHRLLPLREPVVHGGQRGQRGHEPQRSSLVGGGPLRLELDLSQVGVGEREAGDAHAQRVHGR
jgi:hypothetical protein